MSRGVYNFSSGPAMLPEPVLERVRSELTDLDGSGMSIVEISHRSSAFEEIAHRTESTLRRVLSIPEDYRVLFMQGGASLQFSAVPLNLAPPGSTVDYLVTGHWSSRAAREAARYCSVNVAADGGPLKYRAIPDPADWSPTSDAAYLAYAANETIDGVEFPFVPPTDAALVADMSSTILSRPIDVSRFGLIFFGAQKNLGPAGLTIVVVRDDLVGGARPETPTLLDYAEVARSGSMLNTPPTFSWYVAGLVLEWIEAQGGLTAIGTRNRRKGELLYGAIDGSRLYRNDIDSRHRSWTNVTFRLTDPALEERFLVEAAQAGLVNLKGHRSIGGLRASIYNAMPAEGVETLVEFMTDFERRVLHDADAEATS